MQDIEREVEKMLFELQDLKYREFQCKLIPTVNPDRVIGVRTPELRKLAKKISKLPNVEQFSKNLPHKYYDENNLHGFLIEQIKEFDICIKNLDKFLPYVDNWATCDLMSPKILKKHLPELMQKIKIWIKSDKTYTVRFGIKMMMLFFLDDEFNIEYLELVAGIKSQEYYINTMIAWYFATALAKHYEIVLPYIENRCLEKWTHNKTVQKAIESYRITNEQKDYLRILKEK